MAALLHFLVICSLLTSVYSSSILWYKKTIYHSQNIEQVNNGWIECPDWDNPSTTSYQKNSNAFRSNKKTSHSVSNNITSECINLILPLNWDDSNNTNMSYMTKTINYFITHIYNQNNIDNNINGAFWMLEGGPGSDGLDFYPHAITFINYVNSSYDVYIPSHRGTGHSSPLYCPTELYNTPNRQECINYLNGTYGNDIHYYSTYSASMDLGYVIDLFKQNMTTYSGYNNTVIYSLSYGTYYLNQYLILFPNQSNAVIMDGICPSDRCRFAVYDNNTNSIGSYFVTLCEQNEFCNSIFDNNKTAFDIMVALWDNNGTGIKECIHDKLTLKEMKFIFFTLLRRWYQRVFIFPILYRLNRCNENDINALNILSEYFKSTLLYTNTSNITYLLRDHIPLSEMYYGTNASIKPPFTYEEIINITNGYYITPYFAAQLRPIWDIWNKYAPNPLVYNKYANVEIPMLLMNGNLDHQTPMYWAYHGANGYNATIDDINQNSNKYFITIPNAPHFVLERSPLINQSEFGYTVTCGLDIIASFIDLDNNFVPDISCLNWIEPIDFEGNTDSAKELSLLYFGTEDMWGMKEDSVDEGIEVWLIVIIVVVALFLLVIIGILLKRYKCCAKTQQHKILLESNDKQHISMYGN